MSIEFVLERTSPDLPRTQLASTLLGLSPEAVRHVLARRLLDSAEARRLIEVAPGMMRSLDNELQTRETLEMGTISGPVVWPKTISARAANGFPSDLFVCKRPERTVDIPGNRVLLHALSLLDRASRDLERYGTPMDEIPMLTEIRQLGRQARRLRRHRRLDGVAKVKGSVAEEVRKTIRSRRGGMYRPALELIAFDRGPLRVADLDGLADRNAVLLCSLARVAVGVVDEIFGQHHVFELHHGRLWAGHLSFAHPGPRTLERWPSVQIGERVVAVAPPGERRQSPLTVDEQKKYPDGDLPIVSIHEPESDEGRELIRATAARGLRGVIPV